MENQFTSESFEKEGSEISREVIFTARMGKIKA